MAKRSQAGKPAAWSADRWIALGAAVIAGGALSLAIYSAWLERDYLRRSQRPEIQVSFFFNDEGSGFLFGNTGVGPARLEWFQILVDDKPQINWAAMLAQLGIAPRPAFRFVRPGPNYQVDTYNEVFWVGPGPGDQRLRAEKHRVELRACYCSLFDECWTSSTRSGPERVESCRPAPEVRFGGRPS